MNSLTYISRQFDALAPTSAAAIRSAPPSPAPNRHCSIHDENTLSSSIPAKSPSRSLPEIRTRRASQPSSSLRGRSKAQAFLHGPRRRHLTTTSMDSNMPIDPANVPLPPSPSVSPIALPQSETSSPPWSAPGECLSHRSSPSPAGRKRRRRRTVSAIVLRAFVSMWHLLLSTWLWFIGEEKGRRLSPPAAGRIKRVRTEKPAAAFLREKALSQDVDADEQSDATLVDYGDGNESKRSTLVESSDSDVFSHLSRPALDAPASFQVPQDPASVMSPDKILLETSSSPLSHELASILRQPHSPTERVHITLPPPSSVPEHGSDGTRTQARRRTPWPSQERIVAPAGRVERIRSTDDEDEEAEVDEVLMRRPKRRSAALVPTPTPNSPSLSALDFNIPSIHARDSEEKGKQADRGFPPRTIITPPSSERIFPPEAHPSTEVPPDGPSPSPAPPSAPASGLRMKPCQTLLPNRLGDSYLTPSSSRKSHRSSPDHTEAPASRQSTRSKTPFHRPKTLVLDLDETLIHSTSLRAPPSSGGGSGGLLDELGGLFLNGGNGGGFGGMGLFSSGLLSGAGALLGKGGDRTRAGHMIEVVLNGRSTLYTVYKRPFVDYFLRKVRGVIFLSYGDEYLRMPQCLTFDRFRDGTHLWCSPHLCRSMLIP